MPRDSDKNNDSRGRRDRPSGGKGRSGAARGPEKKFAKRGDRPFAGRPTRGGDDEKRSFKPREDRGGEKRHYTPRGDRPNFNRDDRAPRWDRKGDPRDRDDARPAGRFSDRKFGDKKPYTPREGGGEKRPYTPRGEGFRKDGDRPRGDRPFSARPPRDGDRPRGDRPERKFGGDKKFGRGAPDRKGDRAERGPRKDFGDRPQRGESKPWQKREDRGGEERPRFSRSREDRPAGDRPFRERPKFDRPRQRPE